MTMRLAIATAAVLSLVAGCGRIWYDPLADEDAGAVDAARSDGAADDGGRAVCDWRLGPQLSAPEQLDALSLAGADDFDPVLDPDGTAIYFASNRGGGDYQVFTATRAAPGEPFGAPVLATLVDGSNSGDFRFGLTADRRTAFLSSNRSGGGPSTDVWVTARATDSDPFPPLQLATGANSNLDDHDPEMYGDGTELWLAPAADGNTQSLAMARRLGDTLSFEAAQPVNELNEGPLEADPALTDDGLTIVFTSSRGGNEDLWYAVRDDRSQPFGTPMLVPDVNDPGVRDGDADLSGDGCELVFSSQRDSGNFRHDLYRVVFLPSS